MFEFATATKIQFGRGVLGQAGPAVRALGKRALIVTGKNPQRSRSLRENLTAVDVSFDLLEVTGEPTIQLIQDGIARVRQAEVVIGLGGGSVIDAAKALAGLATNPGDLFDYLEIIGRGQPLTRHGLPCIAIPTTAGTGSEVTRNSVLGSPEHRIKVSLRSQFLLPRLALIDPELASSLSPQVTAYSGLDALTQNIEPYVSSRANPITDAISAEGMRRAAKSLQNAYELRSPEAREDMALASLFGGLALANAGLGAVHGFASPIGGAFSAPHGAICAALLPKTMEINVHALTQRDAGGAALARYSEIGKILTGSDRASAGDGIEWVRNLCRGLRVLPLSEYGVAALDADQMVSKAKNASSMKANPIELTEDELTEIFLGSL